MLEIEDVRLIVLGVVFGAEVAFLVRAIWTRALAGIVNPADDVIVIFLFADAAEIRSESAADGRVALAHGMARETAARFKQLLAVGCIAWLLMLECRTGERTLPDKRGNCLDIARLEAELRHLGGRPELARVPDPVRNPFLAQFHARFFEVRADFFYFLLEIVGALFERFGLRIETANFDGEVGSLRIILFGGGVIGGLVAEFLEARNFKLVVGLL